MTDFVFGLIALGVLVLFASGVWFGARLVRPRSRKPADKCLLSLDEAPPWVEILKEVLTYIVKVRGDGTSEPRSSRRKGTRNV